MIPVRVIINIAAANIMISRKDMMVFTVQLKILKLKNRLLLAVGLSKLDPTFPHTVPGF
jgi:hypothetical protein